MQDYDVRPRTGPSPYGLSFVMSESCVPCLGSGRSSSASLSGSHTGMTCHTCNGSGHCLKFLSLGNFTELLLRDVGNKIMLDLPNAIPSVVERMKQVLLEKILSTWCEILKWTCFICDFVGEILDLERRRVLSISRYNTEIYWLQIYPAHLALNKWVGLHLRP